LDPFAFFPVALVAALTAVTVPFPFAALGPFAFLPVALVDASAAVTVPFAM